jgi:hypothetical protein
MVIICQISSSFGEFINRESLPELDAHTQPKTQNPKSSKPKMLTLQEANSSMQHYQNPTSSITNKTSNSSTMSTPNNIFIFPRSSINPNMQIQVYVSPNHNSQPSTISVEKKMLGIKTTGLSSYEYLCLTLLLLFDEKQVHINQTKEKYGQIDQRHIQRPSH